MTLKNARLIVLAIAFVCVGVLGACDPSATTETPATTVEGETTQAATADARPAYEGTWAVDAASCAIPQDQQGAPHIFGADNYDQHETHCTYANVSETAPDAWSIAGACQVEGHEASLGWDVSVDGGTMMMDGTRLVRCPATPAP